MSLKDYEHWNEDAYYMWYHEEGKHPYEPPEPDDDMRVQEYDEEDFCEKCCELNEDCVCDE